jgi:dihydropteroate synthase
MRSLGINDLIWTLVLALPIEQNYEVLRKAELFKSLELPLLIGISRKSGRLSELKSQPQVF